MNTQAYLTPELKNNFVELIAKQTGLEVREQHVRTLKENIALRQQHLNLRSPEAYYEFLASSTSDSDKEWQHFVCLMTNRESYFFRDKGQFKLLRNHLFPELIQRHQKTKKLQICSAGCSTGQEPYSLAILLTELIPDIDNWNVKIVGIDINKDSLDVARKGSYNEWSFRMVEDHIKQRYFNKKHLEYHLDPKIKKMVSFDLVNLVKDPLPRSEYELRDFDLIICRNVFIYFVELAIVKVLEKFYNMLQPFGYLMTGHAEVGNQHLKRFQTKLFPESIIYQRPSATLENLGQQEKPVFIPPQKFPPKPPTNKVVQPQPPQKQTPPTKKLVSPPTSFAEVKELIQQKSYFLAIPRLEKIIQQSPNNFEAYYLMAQIHANLAKHQQAIAYCEEAIKVNYSFPEVYYLLAEIFEEQGDIETSKKHLKTIIYLFPEQVAAYLKLASIYQQEFDYKKTKKMQELALTFLQKLPQDQLIPELENTPVERLINQLETSLSIS